MTFYCVTTLYRNRYNASVFEKNTFSIIEKGEIFMAITGGEYGKMAKKASPPSRKVKNGFLAFAIGGLVCAIGEGLGMIYQKIGIGAEDIKALIPSTLIVIAAVLTALGVFDKIAYYAGAGTIVPITGFANSIVSPAMEFKPEVLGTGANMFRIAGPVLAYGSAASVIYGIIYYLFLK